MDFNCRGCSQNLSENSVESISLFAPYKDQYCLPTIILESVGLKVDEHDRAPKFMCTICADKLIDIQHFRTMYIECDRRFQTMLNTVTNLVEPSETCVAAKTAYFDNDSNLSLVDADDILTEALSNVFGWESFAVAEKAVVEAVNQEQHEALVSEINTNFFELEIADKAIETNQEVPTIEYIQNVQGIDITVLLAPDNPQQIAEIGTTVDSDEHGLSEWLSNLESCDETAQSYISSGRLSPTSSSYQSASSIANRKQMSSDSESFCSNNSHTITSTGSPQDQSPTSTQSYNKEKKKKNTGCDYLCRKCEMVFSTTDQLKKHTASHNNKLTQCPYCPKAFSHKSNLNRHLPLHEQEMKFTCEKCDQEFEKSDELFDHLKAYPEHKAKNPNKVAAHTQKYVLECETCDYQTVSYAGFVNHMRNQHPEVEVKKAFKCQHCGEGFRTKQGMFRHVDSIHENNRLNLRSTKKNFLCNTCGKSFFSNVQLIVHERTHNGEKPYKCKYCNKSFAQISGLKMHTYTHTGERPFVCRICEKSFTQPNHLKEHLLVHEGVKPHVCSICDHSFRVKGNLTSHMLTHIGSSKYKCMNCKISFPKKSKWLIHMKKCRA